MEFMAETQKLIGSRSKGAWGELRNGVMAGLGPGHLAPRETDARIKSGHDGNGMTGKTMLNINNLTSNSKTRTAKSSVG